MIRGFAREPSVVAGDALELCVATGAETFSVEVWRWGAAPERVGTFGSLAGGDAPDLMPHEDWGTAWPVHSLAVGAGWRPGAYVAVLREAGTPDEPVPALDARSARALFVVRPRTPRAPVLLKLPLLTYHAYNQVSAEHWTPERGVGGWCLYSDFHPLPVAGPPVVSVRRPGGGTGAHTFDAFNPDPYDASSPRQTFAHWDAPALAWLERAGYEVEVCTDLDLHREGEALLAPHRLLLSVGHDEYWSSAMRDGVERFVGAGGNAAFLGGNTAWWSVAFDDEHAFRRTGHWHEVGRPEDAMTGVSFRNGGERPAGQAGPPVGFRVEQAAHWVFAGTGLRDGDVFGDGPDEALVGYECDGADGEDFEVLATGDVAAAGWGSGRREATLGLHAPGGIVFTAATTDWPRVLAQGDPVVGRITRNVLERLG